jgi:sialic acid synthase SpsE
MSHRGEIDRFGWLPLQEIEQVLRLLLQLHRGPGGQNNRNFLRRHLGALHRRRILFQDQVRIGATETERADGSPQQRARRRIPCLLASGDLKSEPLLKHVASFGKPIIVSTGGALLDDVKRCYDTVMAINPQLCILQCTAGYPAAFEELDLRVIAQYRDLFPKAVVGFSGHDNGIAMAVAAYVLGARVVEKHFTLNRAMKGTDHAFSLEPVGLRKMVRDLERTASALGDGVKKIYDSEKAPILKMGKSLVVARDLPAGHVIGPKDVVMKSPAGGIPPYDLAKVLGRVTLKALHEDDFLSFEVLGTPEGAPLARS